MTKLKQFISHLLVALLALTSFATMAHADVGANLSLSPDKTTLNIGDTFKVSVMVSVNGFQAGSVRARVKYDPAILTYSSVSDAGSVFPSSLAFSADTGTGLISSSRYSSSSGVTGAGKVIDLIFTAKAAGTTIVALDDASGIWEVGTGTQEPLTLTNSPTITVAAPPPPATPTPTPAPTQAPSNPTPTPAPVANNPTPTPAPVANNPTPKPATKVVTPAPKPAAKVTTPAPTANTSSTTVSATQSTVTFSNTTAVANGEDTITVTVTLKNDAGVVLGQDKATPEIQGLRQDSDVSSPFTFDTTNQDWVSQITSTQPGIATVTLSAQSVTLATQDLTFTQPTPAPAVTPGSTASGSSFLRTILIGLLLLILLLVLLFFLWRRLHQNGEDEGDGSFPGSDETPPPTTPPAAAETVESDAATLNPTQVLERSAPPPAEAAVPTPPPPAPVTPPPAETKPDDTIPL